MLLHALYKFLKYFRSATGKSTLLKQLVELLPKKTTLYLINVKGEEMSHYKKTHSNTVNLTYAGIKNIKKNSFVIVEDIINLKSEEEISLRNAINYTVHHLKSKLFCVSHTITRTGIYSMISLFNYVIFTGSPSNLPIMRSCLRYFKIENELVDKWLACVKRESRLKQSTSKWNPYYFFDCTKMVFCSAQNLVTMKGAQSIGTMHDLDSLSSDDETADYVVDSNSAANPRRYGKKKTALQSMAASDNHWLSKDERSADKSRRTLSSEEEKLKRLRKIKLVKSLKETFSSFFQGHRLYSQALAIFTVVLKKIQPERFDPADLSLCFARKKLHQNRKKISVIDYIACLLEPQKTPSIDHLVLHGYISNLCVLPVSCLLNKHFLPKK